MNRTVAIVLLPLLLALALLPACWRSGSLDGAAAPDADVDTDADTDTDVDSDSDSDSDSDTDSDTDADTDADSDSDSDTDADTDSNSDVDSDSDTDTPDCTFECLSVIMCEALGGEIHPEYYCYGLNVCCDQGADSDTGCVDADEDWWCDPIDCDDSDPDVNPGADEVPDNGTDDDCDGYTDEEEPDTGSDTESDSDTDSDTETGTDTGSDTESDTGGDTDTDTDPAPDPLVITFWEQMWAGDDYHQHRLLIGPGWATNPEDSAWTVLADGAAMDNPLWDESYGWVQGFVADISAWSGQVMRFAWHYYGDGGDDAWFVDDVCMGWGDGIDDVPTTCIYNEGFEDPGPTDLPIDWTDVEGSADEFFSPDWETHADEFHTGATSAWFDGVFPIGICDRYLMGPPIYLPAE